MAHQLQITGMTCEHCVGTVERALGGVPGVHQVKVQFPKGTASVTTTVAIPANVLLAAVERVGYGGAVLPAKEAGEEGPSLHVAIVGSGSAAFACAIRLAEGGARVTLVEAGTLGGTCVNVGCVPSKIFIRAAQMAHDQRAHPFGAGLSHCQPAVDRAALVAQQQGRVEELRQAKYANVLAAHPSITLIKGRAAFADAQTLVVHRPDGHTQQRIGADRFLVAVGARPHVPPGIPGLEKAPYWTSTEALVASQLPRHLIVLGGSVVAVELAQAFRRLGTAVTIVARSTLLSKEDPALGAGLQAAFEAEGIRVLTHIVPTAVQYEDGTFSVNLGQELLQADRLLVATGRIPNTGGLGLDKIGVKTNEAGAVIVDAHMRSSVAHIYAAGDCTTHPQFVYVAAAAGTRAAVNMLGGDARLELSVMPAVIFTDPQVATVGLDERSAQAQGLQVESRTLNLENVPRALANFQTQGFIKLVAEATSRRRLLGAQILAAEGGEIIQAVALALRGGLTISDLADQLFPYLTMVEAIKLCAQTFTKDVSQLSCCAG